jgi:hypothetical protein
MRRLRDLPREGERRLARLDAAAVATMLTSTKTGNVTPASLAASSSARIWLGSSAQVPMWASWASPARLPNF